MRLLETLLEWITLVGFIGMLLATGAQVVFRYVLEISVPWTEELAGVLFTTTMFLGMAIALRENEHIIVDFLFKRMGPKAQAAGNLIIYLAVFLFLVLLASGALKMVRVTWESHLIALNWISTGYLYLAELVAICIMLYYAAAKFVANAAALFGTAAGRRKAGAP
jgi:TRAP-type C4-dicarboxylate transport system permease small subunit